jgi:hypothetical protein
MAAAISNRHLLHVLFGRAPLFKDVAGVAKIPEHRYKIIIQIFPGNSKN